MPLYRYLAWVLSIPDFKGLKGWIMEKCCNFLKECSACSPTCLYPLSRYIHITDCYSSKNLTMFEKVPGHLTILLQKCTFTFKLLGQKHCDN